MQTRATSDSLLDFAELSKIPFIYFTTSLILLLQLRPAFCYKIILNKNNNNNNVNFMLIRR